MNTVAEKVIAAIKRLFERRPPDQPEDPHSYVTAPKKPRTPHLSASAVAELPEP
jgi:hypothetical protein